MPLSAVSLISAVIPCSQVPSTPWWSGVWMPEESEVLEVLEVPDPPIPSPFPTSASGVDFIQLAKDQLSCSDVLRLQKSPSLRLIPVSVNGNILICDAKTKVLRPLVPSSQRFNVFKALHGLPHPGICASRRLISARFVWRGLANDVRDYCHSCLPCQRGKILRHVQLRPEKIPVPFRRFSHVHVDLI